MKYADGYLVSFSEIEAMRLNAAGGRVDKTKGTKPRVSRLERK
jgi:hypothetical protein